MDFFADNRHANASDKVAFSANPLVRDSEQIDENVLSDLWSDDAAQFYLFADGSPIFQQNGSGETGIFSKNQAEQFGVDKASTCYLGRHNGGPVAVANLVQDPTLPDEVETLDLRSLVISDRLAAEDYGILSHGFSFLSWHRNNSFCAKCGAKSAKTHGGYRRKCPSCESEIFPRLDPVSIMLVVDGERCLLGRQPHFAPGMYSCLAGFIEPGETLENAVRREVLEEAGLKVSTVRFHATQPWPFPHTLMIGCFAKAETTDIDMDVTELEDCRWFDRAELGQMLAQESELKTPPEMAIAHHLIRAFYDFPN